VEGGAHPACRAFVLHLKARCDAVHVEDVACRESDKCYMHFPTRAKAYTVLQNGHTHAPQESRTAHAVSGELSVSMLCRGGGGGSQTKGAPKQRKGRVQTQNGSPTLHSTRENTHHTAQFTRPPTYSSLCSFP